MASGKAAMVRALVWAFFLVATAGLTAARAEKGLEEDFTGEPLGWAKQDAYKWTQQDGVFTLAVDKQTKWAGQFLDLGRAYDLSGNPYVNLRVRTDTPCLLHVYLRDGENVTLTERRLRVTEGWVDLFYDYSDPGKLDLSKVNSMIFAVNGAANSWSGTLQFDRLRVGDRAKKLASIEGMGPQIRYRDTGPHTVLVTGLEGAARVEVSGAQNLIRNPKVGPIRDGQAELTYACAPGATGEGRVTLTTVGAADYADNSIWFSLTVEDDLPPTVDGVDDQTVKVGRREQIELHGISDGNVAAEQPIEFSISTSDADVVPAGAVEVHHAPGSPHATLSLTAKGAGRARVTVALDDGGIGRKATEVTFRVQAVPEWNNPPTIAPVDAMTVYNDAGRQEIVLTGIDDGDPGSQRLTITAESSDESVIPNPVRVEYDGGQTATLVLRPAEDNVGTATITVTVKDEGGTRHNNGDQQTQMSFEVTTRVRPLEAYRDTFEDWEESAGRWRPEDAISVSHETVSGQDVTRVEVNRKITFGGLWYDLPDLDLSEYPYVTVDVKPEDDLEFNLFLYDGNEARNSGANQKTKIPAGKWTTVTFDFTGEGQMETNKGKPIRADWIAQALFNFHPKLDWPFNRYSGTLYFRDLRFGKAADVPERKPVCAVDAVPDQVHLQDAGGQRVALTGIGDGDGGLARVSADSAGSAVISALKVGRVDGDGTAVLSYEVGGETGTAAVTVRVTADGSETTQSTFEVAVLDDDSSAACNVTVDCSEKHQVIHGFGTFSNDVAPEIYAGELGASAMRVGLIGNQIEPANDNSDVEVLYRGALNYDAFDFAHYRDLHEAGVETFILTSWSPPAWMKPNRSLNYQQGGFEGDTDRTLNRLHYYLYDEFAESMVAAIHMFREEAGIELAGIGLQNEPAFHEPYPSAILDPEHFVELIKVAGRRFEREGIEMPLFMPEQVFSQTASMNQYIDALNADPAAEKHCDIIGTHGYDAKGVGEARPDFSAWKAMWNRAQRGSVPKEMWMTETFPVFRGWESAFRYALYLYGSLEYGNIGLWTSWSIESQLLTRGKPNASLYTCSQYYRYIRPGARRVTSASSDGQVLATSYVNDAEHGGGLVTVLINNGDTAKAVRLSARGGPRHRRLAVTSTDPVRRHEERGTVNADALILLPPESVTSLVGE